MSAVLARETFSTSRLIEFSSARELVTATGHDIDDLIRALEAAGGSQRLVKALRAELAMRRGGKK